MATPIKIKRSAVSGKRPRLIDLQVGELALNTYDGYLFTERDTGGVAIATTVSNLTPWTESYGASSISYLNSVGIGTTNPTAKLDVTGDSTFTGSMTVANGSGVIEDAGGQLKIRANHFNFKDIGNTRQLLLITQLGGARLYHNGNQKFETLNDGVDITGTLTADLIDGGSF